MLFGKLMPREGNFFEMFNQHADRIVEAARAFSHLVANYSDVHLREQYNRDVDNAERATTASPTKSTRRCTRPSSRRLTASRFIR